MFKNVNDENRFGNRKYLLLALLALLLVGAGYVFMTSTPHRAPEELTGVLHEGDPGFESYKEFLSLKNSRIQMGLNFNRKRVVMFSGEIENRGEKTIDVVELRIMYFNYEELIDTVIKTPIMPGPYTKAIEPLTSGTYNFYIEEFPGSWKGSECEVYLNGFRFAGE